MLSLSKKPEIGLDDALFCRGAIASLVHNGAPSSVSFGILSEHDRMLVDMIPTGVGNRKDALCAYSWLP